MMAWRRCHWCEEWTTQVGGHRCEGFDNRAGVLDTIARSFHDAYERLAPQFGYRTRDASAKPWDDVPDDNQRLMRATVRDLLNRGVIVVGRPSTSAPERSDASTPLTEQENS